MILFKNSDLISFSLFFFICHFVALCCSSKSIKVEVKLLFSQKIHTRFSLNIFQNIIIKRFFDDRMENKVTYYLCLILVTWLVLQSQIHFNALEISLNVRFYSRKFYNQSICFKTFFVTIRFIK